MKAYPAIGFKKAVKFFIWPLVYGVFRLLPYPPLRTLYLRLLGAKIGKNTVIHGIKFFNFYRGSFRFLQTGDDCFLGNEVLIDLSAPIRLGNQVTLAERVTVLTHSNVGYTDHPLQTHFPSQVGAVTINSGCFVGLGSVVLCGTNIGENSFIGALSLVNKDIPLGSLALGVPVNITKKVQE